ncbi:hypothetical protein SASPL_135522 [Salvia splendens]|uniref:RNase H type-1 domain-containing protein n=1 Tax=Salvia splendens TaxID=180675 RepID=A0A8X8WWP0_SALSN|nr:hypothetical protein SASPL_135522 [Salvia splendens]
MVMTHGASKAQRDKGGKNRGEEDDFQLYKGRKGGQGRMATMNLVEIPQGDKNPEGMVLLRRPQQQHIKPSYYRQSENGGFDVESFEEVMDAEIIAEEDDGGSIFLEGSSSRPDRNKLLQETSSLAIRTTRYRSIAHQRRCPMFGHVVPVAGEKRLRIRGVNFQHPLLAGRRLKRRVTRAYKITWAAPSENWIKVNTDGAFSSSRNTAGGGGIIRDSYGKMMIRMILTKRELGPAPVRHIIRRIREKLLGLNVKISSIAREGNKPADFLAEQGQWEQGLRFFDLSTAPSRLRVMVEMDEKGLPNFHFQRQWTTT